MQRRAVPHTDADGTKPPPTTRRTKRQSGILPRRRRKRGKSSLFNNIRLSHDLAEWLESGFTLVLILVLLCLIYLVLHLLSSLNSSAKETGGSSKIKELKSGDRVEDLEALPWNDIYRVKDAMETVGDRSNHYAKLRQETDELLSPDVVQDQFNKVHSRQLNYESRLMEAHHSDQVAYDIYDCPTHPPAGYPYSWKTLDILRDWPADQTTPPTDANGNSLAYNSLCIFDFQKDQEKALNYREASKPFIVVNDPQVQETVARWSLPNYMDRLLGAVPHRTEHSENNHFMYYVPMPKHVRRKQRHQAPEGWTAPTKAMRMPYTEWLRHANVTDEHTTPQDEHWYFRLIGCGTMGNDGSCDKGSSEYLFDELPFFQPKPSLYVVEPDEQKGIHCRFGMKGVIAENHFDSSRNSIVLLSGSRRYILAHPDQCSNMALYEKGHPSARHSAVDWSDPDLEEYPEFANAMSHEVVLQPGMVLYLPTNWFHFIVSLELNMQCNTRSGTEPELMAYVRDCGF